MYTLVGSGLIGSYIHSQLECTVYTRNNIELIDQVSHSTIIVAAPTSNRVWVNSHPDDDLLNCQQLHAILSRCSYHQLLLISTVDTFVDNYYGKNRLWFEQALSKLPNVKIIRLPMICHTSIKKNTLYDIKNECWLDKINIDSEFQYYPLDCLVPDILKILSGTKQCHNLTSRPISNRYLIEKYNPALLSQVESNNSAVAKYDIKNHNNTYSVAEQTILKNIEKYFNENRR